MIDDVGASRGGGDLVAVLGRNVERRANPNLLEAARQGVFFIDVARRAVW